MSYEVKPSAKERIMELKKAGKSYAEITETLNHEGYLNSKSAPWTVGAVQMTHDREKKRLEKEGKEAKPANDAQIVGASETSQDAHVSHTESVADETMDNGETCETCETRQQDEPVNTTPTIAELTIADLRNLIRKEMKTMIDAIGANHANTATVANTAQITESDIPPAIPKVAKTKRFQGERATLPGCRIDKVLADLFEDERKEARISASELMQRILWNRYGHPKLSFEE
ncbi:hypothetical protein [Desulfomonile tiedjei]|uniref:Uncharacterized protein n=1 Tax=Desulfomonile tiedjei (strain ATCC 49306 / DSM 6799 / DCB-1) TaxID=706587 RepID=I4CE28_DESTA|nr:hypothetical protein [Desulfomonile tiedjei]AFM27819.1 hypothetical protein Desti_5222 [Desulfomonile tiedjei DSM 6799]